MISGIGRKATQATAGETQKKMAPTARTVVESWIRLLAPPSRKRSSWLTSSFRTLMSSPEF